MLFTPVAHRHDSRTAKLLLTFVLLFSIGATARAQDVPVAGGQAAGEQTDEEKQRTAEEKRAADQRHGDAIKAASEAPPEVLPKYVLRTAETPKDELAYNLKVDIPVTLIAGVILGTAEGLKNLYGPTTCRWCDTRETLNSFDSSAISTFSSANRRASATASDVLAYGAIPVFALGLDLISNYQNRNKPGKHWAKRFGVDTLLILEATVTALSLHAGTRFISGRRRPLAIDEPTDGQREVDKNLSFFSGHTTLAFVVATTMATELSLRHHKLAPVAWALGMAGATCVAMLRVSSDNHFVTDTIVGAVVGSAIGVIVPVIHRGNAPIRLGGNVTTEQGLVTVAGRF